MKKRLFGAAIIALIASGCGDGGNPAGTGSTEVSCSDTITYLDDADLLEKGMFTDIRDCRIYRVVKIGDRIWMAENLNYKTMDGKGSWCFAQNDAARAGQLDCETYGRFYDWTTAMAIDPMYFQRSWNGGDENHQGVCPDGWRLPNYSDWENLIEATGDPETAGTKLKAADASPKWHGKATDDFGFSALPAGYRQKGGWFYHLQYYAYWWTATQYDYTNALHWSMSRNTEGMISGWNRSKIEGFSVRCVKK